MSKINPRIAVIGAGAIGGVTAGYLALKGHDIEIVCKHREIVDRIRAAGLRVSGIGGEFHAQMPAVKDIFDLSGEKDIVFIATKTNSAVDAALQVLPFLADDAVVVSLQNGIVEDDIAEVVGKERVIGCVVGWSATMLGPADVVFTRTSEFVAGDLYGLAHEKVHRIATVLESVTSTRISENIRGELYSKLIINCCINSLAAITGQTLGALLGRKKARDLFIEIMKEAFSVAQALGIKVEPALGGKLDYYEYLAGNDTAAQKKREDTLVLMGKTAGNIKPSSLQSLERGRPTETPWLNGYIISRAGKVGVPVPVNQAIVNLIEQIEQNMLQMSPDNLSMIEI